MLSYQLLVGLRGADATKNSSCLGMKREGWGGLSGGRMFLYEQGGSSDGLRGLQGGTVLRERKAKMEGS